MKQETKRRLLEDFSERDFTLAQMAQILTAISMYLTYRKMWIEYPQTYERAKIEWRVETERLLKESDLDYTVGELIDED